MKNKIHIIFFLFLFGFLQFNIFAMSQEQDCSGVENRSEKITKKDKGKQRAAVQDETFCTSEHGEVASGKVQAEMQIRQKEMIDRDAEFAAKLQAEDLLHQPDLSQQPSTSSAAMLGACSSGYVNFSDELEGATKGIAAISLENDSDSEDEEDYEYGDYGPLQASDLEHETKVFVFYRGIHFASNKFSTKQRSFMRRYSGTGIPIFSSAAYELVKVSPLETSANIRQLEEKAKIVRQQIMRLSQAQRHEFQRIYTNTYDKFHTLLQTKLAPVFSQFTFTRNPQVSTSEEFRHAGLYAFGQKFLGGETMILDPDYDSTGKPKHPYLGKISVILIPCSNTHELDPFFVVYAYKRFGIKFHCRIVYEREVSIPGFIPGAFIVFEVNARVPSFAGPYKKYYEQKYGLDESKFKCIKSMLLDPRSDKKNVIQYIIQGIIKYLSKKIENHIRAECRRIHGLIVYKDIFGDGFSTSLPVVKEKKKQK